VGIKLSTDFLKQWEHIINTVDKTEVPAHLIEKLVIKLLPSEHVSTSEQTIDVGKLKQQGFEHADIENVINETLYELNDYIDAVDFFLDIEAVAKEVQPETDKVLNKFFTKE
jgi:hypothetical protein